MRDSLRAKKKPMFRQERNKQNHGTERRRRCKGYELIETVAVDSAPLPCGSRLAHWRAAGLEIVVVDAEDIEETVPETQSELSGGIHAGRA